MKFTVIVFAILLFSIPIHAQHKYDWSKYNRLPFKKNSVKGDKGFPDFKNIIYPIKKTNADIEIRCHWVGHGGYFGIYTLKFYQDSISVINITAVPIFECKENPAEKNNDWFKIDSNQCYKAEYYAIGDTGKVILDNMIKNGLFTTISEKEAKEKLKKKHAKDIQASSAKNELRYTITAKRIHYYEVMTKTKFRSFYSFSLRYDDINTKYESVDYGSTISKIFNILVNYLSTKNNKYETGN